MKIPSILLVICFCQIYTQCKKQNAQKIVPTVQTEFKTQALLGEGAFWNYKTQELYWIDIIGKTLNIYNPANKTNHSFSTPSFIGTVVPQTDSTAVVALVDGIYLQNTKTAKLQLLSDIEADKPYNRFNDGKCDPQGNFWVGSLRMDQSEPSASLYKITPEGKSTKMLDNITISNGIVWSSDKKTMYYIDTPTQKIRAFDYNLASATITNERVAVEVLESLGSPDGMAIDSEDMLWVGLWNGDAVARFNPITGKLLQKIAVPAHNVTSCAFGGENLDVLYITTSSLDMTEEEKTRYPLAGSLFRVKPGVKGVKSAFFGSPAVE